MTGARILLSLLVLLALSLVGAIGAGPATLRIAMCRVPVTDPQTRAAGDKRYLWKAGSVLKVAFLDGDLDLRRQVAEIAREWTRYANLDFKFVEQGTGAQAAIRVSFEGRGYWSAVGRGSLNRELAPRESLSLEHLWEQPPDEFRKHVLHEFGHALGLVHEHQNSAARIHWNRPYVIEYLSGPPNRFTRAEIEMNIFATCDVASTNYSAFDPHSIMLYYFPAEFTVDGVETPNNTDLSETDRAWIAKLYPGRTLATPAPGGASPPAGTSR